jgi:hypothetical protein
LQLGAFGWHDELVRYGRRSRSLNADVQQVWCGGVCSRRGE